MALPPQASSIVFLDLDGTILHKGERRDSKLRAIDYGVSQRSFIHQDAIALIVELLGVGVAVVIGTGRRYANFEPVARVVKHHLALLEHGGLIVDSMARPVAIDSQWSDHHWAALDRRSTGRASLWQLADDLETQGYAISREGRCVSIRVETKNQGVDVHNTAREIGLFISARGFRDTFETIINEDTVDVIPRTSGKLNAAKYVVSSLESVPKIHAVGDGENDLALLKFAQHRYCPATATQEVKDIVRANNGYVADSGGAKSAVQLLEEVLRRVR
ncbi:HAD family phosphatase [Planctomycetales bacterium ZRK34]|nr:HAD family phosphatase [Planctomycetales bacterium ZRK34]